MKKYLRKDFYKLLRLYSKQNWLRERKSEVEDLIKFCDKESQKDIIFDLLEEFSFLRQDEYQHNLNKVCDYIISQSGFNEQTTQIVALTKTEASDSGQVVLYHLRNSLYGMGWRKFRDVNKLGSAKKVFDKGYNQVVLFDEFIGSGQTLVGRINELKGMLGNGFTLKCCFIAGMKYAVDSIKAQGIDVYCALELKQGISERYSGQNLVQAEDDMLDLELKLAPWINEKELYTYSFGWKGSESLYSLEGCMGNTPNNVFPVFWWMNDKNGKTRKHLLTRVEEGF
ncbi:MAG: hypothetical protein LKI59_03890 [Bacteroidales bacterium]|jgi:hypothetical protein|nr:hypothetical protein [Bacteroidales bacterium]